MQCRVTQPQGEICSETRQRRGRRAGACLSVTEGCFLRVSVIHTVSMTSLLEPRRREGGAGRRFRGEGVSRRCLKNEH